MLNISRLAAATLAVALLLGGFAAGRVVTTMQLAEPSPRAEGSPTGTGDPALPVVDVDGDDLDRLPRYPGAVRTEYEIRDGDGVRTILLEYLVASPVDDVRVFYRAMFGEHGWTVADQTVNFGEWIYILVDDSVEAIVKLESRGDVTEIDIDMTAPTGGEPTLSLAPTTTVVPPTPLPPAPPPDDDDPPGGDG